MKFGPKTKRFRRLCSLHGRAWIACSDFVEAALGEKRLEEIYSEFYGGKRQKFFPVKVLMEAKKKLYTAYHEAGKENGTHK